MTEPEPAEEEPYKECSTCNGAGVIEISRSGHPLDPDAREVPCPDCSPVTEPDPDAAWDARCDRENS